MNRRQFFRSIAGLVAGVALPLPKLEALPRLVSTVRIPEFYIEQGLSEDDPTPPHDAIRRGILLWIEKMSSDMLKYPDEYGFGPNHSRYGDLEECIRTFAERRTT